MNNWTMKNIAVSFRLNDISNEIFAELEFLNNLWGLGIEEE